LDIASFSNQVLWSAIDKGVPIFTIMDTSANTFMAITRKDIQTCADLDGKSVAIPTVSAVSGVMFDAYVDQNCPGIEPEILIISGGSNRRVALLTGAVDVALQDVDDWIRIEDEAPGRFHALAVFDQEFPGVWINSLATHRDFAQEHPEMLKDVIRAVFVARRSLQDPQELSEAIICYVELDPDEAEHAAEVYLAQGIWDASGMYTLDTVQVTIDFLQVYGDLPPGLEAEDVADLSFYDAVLDEIGRE
jgi:ABC-type nitrate/sulfonate/bicarbonate transport system substrate-binding protein